MSFRFNNDNKTVNESLNNEEADVETLTKNELNQV